jgi:hypothetical protein
VTQPPPAAHSRRPPTAGRGCVVRQVRQKGQRQLRQSDRPHCSPPPHSHSAGFAGGVARPVASMQREISSLLRQRRLSIGQAFDRRPCSFSFCSGYGMAWCASGSQAEGAIHLGSKQAVHSATACQMRPVLSCRVVSCRVVNRQATGVFPPMVECSYRPYIILHSLGTSVGCIIVHVDGAAGTM